MHISNQMAMSLMNRDDLAVSPGVHSIVGKPFRRIVAGTHVTAAALLSLQQDLRSMSAVLLSMRAAVAAAVPAVGDAPADEA